MVCRIDKGIYGLRQSGRLWNMEINSFIVSLGFTRSVSDPYLYVLRKDGEVLYLALYVDDMVIASGSDTQRDWLKLAMRAKYHMKDSE
jgi:hypothetical protein